MTFGCEAQPIADIAEVATHRPDHPDLPFTALEDESLGRTVQVVASVDGLKVPQALDNVMYLFNRDKIIRVAVLPADGHDFRRVPTPKESVAFCTVEEYIKPIGGRDFHIHVDAIIVATADSTKSVPKRDPSEVTSRDWFPLEQIKSEIQTFDNIPVICEAILAAIDRDKSGQDAQREDRP